MITQLKNRFICHFFDIFLQYHFHSWTTRYPRSWGPPHTQMNPYLDLTRSTMYFKLTSTKDMATNNVPRFPTAFVCMYGCGMHACIQQSPEGGYVSHSAVMPFKHYLTEVYIQNPVYMYNDTPIQVHIFTLSCISQFSWILLEVISNVLHTIRFTINLVNIGRELFPSWHTP